MEYLEIYCPCAQCALVFKKTVKILVYLLQKSQKMSGVEAFEKLKQKMKGDNEKEIQKSESDRKKDWKLYCPKDTEVTIISLAQKIC